MESRYSAEFLDKQEKEIRKRLRRYTNVRQIKKELENGDMSLYTKYKQNLVPILNKAIHKIHTGKYGICEKCNEEIELKRLEIVPAAELCMKCLKI